MSKRNLTLLVVGIIVTVVILTGILWRVQTTMTPAQTRADELAVIQLGTKVGVVAQIKAIKDNILTIEVLEGKDYEQPTGMLLQAERGKDHIAMGGEPDVKVGAIAQFDGVKTDMNRMQLNRIVILTGFVKGPPAR